MKIFTKVQTVFLLVGPSSCGKTWFTQNVLMPKLRNILLQRGMGANIQHLSSDNLRREILDDKSLTKSDPLMMQASTYAFEMLHTKLRAATSFPVNSDFVIVDTTGLSDSFRKEVLTTANKNHYNVELIVFGYTDREDYYRFLDKEDVTSKRIIANHVKRLNQDTMREIRRKDYNAIHTIKSNKELGQIEFDVTNLDEFDSTVLPDGIGYTIIGDVHGCLEELKKLIQKQGFVIEGNKITPKKEHKVILLGDIVDKGPFSKETVSFVLNNLDTFIMVKGNHENFVYKLLRNEVADVKEEFVRKYVDSYYLFRDDEKAQAQFMELFTHMRPFVRTTHFIVTHAPCRQSAMGKMTPSGMKAQRNEIYPKFSDYGSVEEFEKALETHFSFLKEDANRAFPMHVFGHTTVRRRVHVGNKLGIDTGCVTGGNLTSVTFDPYGKWYLNEVPANDSIAKQPMPEMFAHKEVFDRKNLDDDEVYRIKKLATHKVNFISGTVSPADKDPSINSLESLDKAFEYYKSNGVTELVLQPKYMGSRCNLYLFQDIEKCYATTRNGFNIHWVDLKPVYEKIIAKLTTKMASENIELLIIDGELMPWSALGKGLIEEQYQVAKQGIASELDILKQTGFEQALLGLNTQYEAAKFSEVSNVMNKKQLQETFGQNKYSTFAAYKGLDWNLIADQEAALSVFDEQLKLYGSEGELEFKPFAYLKTVFKDGSEKLHFDDDNATMFGELSTENFDVVDLNNPDSVEAAHLFYQSVTEDDKLEGIVAKPRKVLVDKVAPFIKVRNPRYLTLIYGYDYQFENKYNKLMRQKGIKRKLQVSISEFALGKKMLEIPYASISYDNEKYFQAVAKMILEEKREKDLDPRL